MSKTFQLQPLIELTQSQTDAAAVRLGVAQVEVDDSEKKLALLLQYRQEYQARFRAAVERGLDAAGWRNFHEFMDKLDAAIEQQGEARVLAKNKAEHAQTDWCQRQVKLKAYDTLAQRHSEGELKRQGKLDQRDQDELAARTHAARRLASNQGTY
jgi:flagellar FliJ protein